MSPTTTKPDFARVFPPTTTKPDFARVFPPTTTIPDFARVFPPTTTKPDFARVFPPTTTKPDFARELFISRPARLEECNEEDMRDLPHALEFIISSFPEFNALERSQKDILFRNFFLQYGCLECAYWSIVFNRCDVLFTLSGNYIDLNNLDFFFGNIDPVKKKKMIEFMEKTCKTFCDTFLKNAFGLMSDKFEFYTLIGYVIFDIALEGQSDECLAVCKEVRNRLMSELIYYYKNVKKIKNTSGRIAKLMQLPPLVQRASNKFREDVEISHIFGIYIFTESFYDLVFAKEPISNGTIAQAINGISNGIAQSINLNTSNNGYVTGQVNEHGLVQLL
ncbi:hypothetical protein WR25_19460 [Diploscapter pachys]|uniref:NR LBD domain-containing protein n=1 Tax=Diploscapter pachys TaxID=2018661 RepID=A0A2A2KLC4_9BILA|nr:hypothetical protein WR25_19460 [Diploscapter pachys]